MTHSFSRQFHCSIRYLINRKRPITEDRVERDRHSYCLNFLFGNIRRSVQRRSVREEWSRYVEWRIEPRLRCSSHPRCHHRREEEMQLIRREDIQWCRPSVERSLCSDRSHREHVSWPIGCPREEHRRPMIAWSFHRHDECVLVRRDHWVCDLTNEGRISA